MSCADPRLALVDAQEASWDEAQFEPQLIRADACPADLLPSVDTKIEFRDSFGPCEACRAAREELRNGAALDRYVDGIEGSAIVVIGSRAHIYDHDERRFACVTELDGEKSEPQIRAAIATRAVWVAAYGCDELGE